MIIRKKLFGCWNSRRGASVAMAMLKGIAGVIGAVQAQAAVIEFFNPDLNNYFITAASVEQDFVDSGAVGRWQRTGNAFATGGPNQVCRFYGSVSPGPNSHFYTVEAAECAELKRLQAITPASQQRWNFESNDFLTTPAVAGACAAGLVPVYRAYNRGDIRGIDSNHRITSNRAAYLETVAAGSKGEGVVMCALPGNPPPTATAAGEATSAATTTIIGAGGGGLSMPEAKITLHIPAGALAADTVIGIQPLTNTAHGKIGAAYRLTPAGQTFLQPITITFAYTDQNVAGSAAEFLGAAFQTAAGYWQWAGDATIDTTAKTMSVASRHFSDWSLVMGLQIRPEKKTVRVNASVGLQVKVCYPVDDGELVTLASDCDTDQGIVATLSVNEWSVNGVPGGGGVFGRVSGNGAMATYTAPTTAPIPNTVAVSARVHNPRKPASAKTLVVSNITIVEAWKVDGTYWAAYHLTGVLCGLENTFALQAEANLAGVAASGVFTFTPTGTSGGTWTYSGAMGGWPYTGNGTYQLAGVESGAPQILMDPGNGTWIVQTPVGLARLGPGGNHLEITQTITMATTTEACPAL